MSTIKDVAAELEQAGKFIAAQIEKARGYEADAKEKVEHALKRADDHWTSVAQRLSEARKLCFESKQNFDDFKRKYAPDLSRTTIYRLTSIGAGTLSIEEQRKTWREEKREKRAAAKESRTKMSETDEAAKKQVEDVIAKLPSSWETPEESSKARTVVYTKPEQPERPQDTRVATAAPTVEPEDAPADVSGGDVVALDGVEQKVGNGPLEEFKRACNKWLPMMTEDERKQARIHHMEWRPKLKRMMWDKSYSIPFWAP